MALFLITGAPGSGKTTTCNELKARGYVAYDGDEDFIAQWFNNESGEALERHTELRTAEFVATHNRGINPDRIAELQQEAAEKTVFLCNNPENETELQHLFAKIVVLDVTEEVQRQRLSSREGNEWGKLPHELEYSLDPSERERSFDQDVIFKVIDSSQSISVIVDHILEFTIGVDE